MATPTPVRIYAGTQEGLFVWRSKNGSWKNLSVAFKTGTIDAIDGLRSKPNVVYLGVTQDGLYRTGDGGESWRRVFEGNVRAVTVDSTDERVIYVGVEPIHLYRSENGGKSWPAFRRYRLKSRKNGATRGRPIANTCAMFLFIPTIVH